MADRSNAAPAPSKEPRLKFIDLARSLAILLMLEGHFVGVTLMEAYRDEDLPLYQIWNFMRGVAAPLFFTVVGLVFVYLLTRDGEPRLWHKPRVRKGLARVVVLWFWGYALQLNLTAMSGGDTGAFRWLQAFHVLQCIGAALAVLIGLYAVHWKWPRIPLSALYAAAVVPVLAVYGFLRTRPEEAFLPAGAPDFVQNMIHGPYSVFPLAPWLAFSLGGGAVGALTRRFRPYVAMLRFQLGFFGVVIATKLVGGALWALKGWSRELAEGYSWFFVRFGDTLLILACLLVLEHRVRIGNHWLFRIGRHTFPVYVLHVIILYGGIFGVGLKDVWRRELTPLEAAAGALAFMAFFVCLVPVFEMVAARWKAWRGTTGSNRQVAKDAK